jgi:hypothetical protein
MGSHSYTSQAGWEITIPAVQARAIRKYGAFRKLQPKSTRHHSDDDE